MSLFALPVTVSDLTQLQSGIQFFTNTAEANTEVGAINANQPNDSVFIYATKLLAANLSLSQVAMAVSALMEGGTIAVGNTTTSNTLTFLSTQFLPNQVTVALANGFNPTVYAAEALGSALATNASFNTNFVTPFATNVSGFSQAVANLTGVNVNAIQQFVVNWTTFFTNNPIALQGRTVTQAAYGSAFGDAVGVALLNPTSANLQTVVSTSLGQTPVQFSPNTIKGLVANALFDVATGQYTTGAALGALPAHTPLQGEFNQLANGVFLTQGVDTPTSGFATDANGTPKVPAGFTATTAGTVISALPFITPFGLGNNTLNTGDDIETTGAATGATKLVDVTSTVAVTANPAFATGVTINGVNVLDITGATPGGANGFQGKVTGLLIENNLNSNGAVTLGGTGQGLATSLTNINISGNGTTGAGNFVNTVVLAAAAGDATKTISIDLKGNLGSNATASAARLSISNDVGGGTAAAPNLTYGTWSITAANNSSLQLNPAVTTDGAGNVITQGGVGGAKTLALAGAGTIAVGQAVAGNWQLLTTIDMSKATGTDFVTGSTSGVGSQARASTGNPGWLFGSTVGLLNEGAAGTFGVTSVLLGSGLTFLDVSSASAAQVAALTTAAGTGVTVNANNEIIVKNSVATSPLAATFAKISGFSDLGIGGPAGADGAGGIIDMKLLPTSINKISYITAASGALTVNNQVNALTIDTFDNGGGNAITVGAVGPAAGLKDSFRLIVGDTFHVGAGAVGNVTLNGDEVVTISSVGATPAVLNTVGFVSVRPTIGGLVDVTIDGTNDLTVGTVGTGGIAAQDAGGALLVNALSITITDPGVVRLHSSTGGAAVLDLKVPGGAGGNGSGGSNPLTNSTNARLIDASASGGLIMEGGDANFVTSATVAGSLGDVLIGSKTGGNVLGGSIGNDIFTSNVSLVGDTIFTAGGADKIALTAGHSASNSLDMYAGFSTAGVTPGTAEIVRFGSITNLNDVPNLGWWGQATGATATGYNATGTSYGSLTAPNTGTSADATSITNFNPTGPTPDIIQLSDSFSGYGVGVHGANGLAGGVTLQLVNGALANYAGAGANGSPVVVQQVNPLNVIAGASNFLELTTGTFATATAVANALDTTYNLTFSAALGAHNSAHMYIAYSDGTNTHIADWAFVNPSAIFAFSNSVFFNNYVSDIAILANTPLTALDGTNVHVMHG